MRGSIAAHWANMKPRTNGINASCDFAQRFCKKDGSWWWVVEAGFSSTSTETLGLFWWKLGTPKGAYYFRNYLDTSGKQKCKCSDKTVKEGLRECPWDDQNKQKMAKMAKNPFFQGKSGNESGNNMASGQVSKIYAETYTERDQGYWLGVMESPIGLTKKGENGKHGKNGKKSIFLRESTEMGVEMTKLWASRENICWYIQ